MTKRTIDQLANVGVALDLLTEELSKLDFCVMKNEKDAPKKVQSDLHSLVSILYVNDKAKDYIGCLRSKNENNR